MTLQLRLFRCLLDLPELGLTRILEAEAVGWFKTSVSSQTQKLVVATKFSDYLGLKHYRNAKKLKHFNHLGLAQRPQSFAT